MRRMQDPVGDLLRKRFPDMLRVLRGTEQQPCVWTHPLLEAVDLVHEVLHEMPRFIRLALLVVLVRIATSLHIVGRIDRIGLEPVVLAHDPHVHGYQAEVLAVHEHDAALRMRAHYFRQGADHGIVVNLEPVARRLRKLQCLEPVTADFRKDRHPLVDRVVGLLDPALDPGEYRAERLTMVMVTIAVELGEPCALLVQEYLVGAFVVRVDGHVEKQGEDRPAVRIVLNQPLDVIRGDHSRMPGWTLYGMIEAQGACLLQSRLAIAAPDALQELRNDAEATRSD